MQPAVSTLVSEYGYDESTQTLAVKFKAGGSTYEYADVPPSVYQEMISAGSMGSFFLQNVKGKYPTTKVS